MSKNGAYVLSAFIAAGSIGVHAAEFGTAGEAKAMLEKAVAEVKKDQAGALARAASLGSESRTSSSRKLL